MKKILAEKREEIIKALADNANTHQVARQIGDVSIPTVWRIAKEIGSTLTIGRPRFPAEKRAKSAAANLRRALEKARMEGNRERIATLLAAADVEVLDKLRPAKAPPATAHLVSLSPGG
jgi:transposase-like protein